MKQTAGLEPGGAASPARTFWSALFGRDAPVEVEIGSGDGTFLLTAAARTSSVHFLGI